MLTVFEILKRNSSLKEQQLIEQPLKEIEKKKEDDDQQLAEQLKSHYRSALASLNFQFKFFPLEALLKHHKKGIKDIVFMNRTVLMLAAEFGFSHAIQSLVQRYGLNVNEKNSEGISPLSIAKESTNSDLICTLIGLGAIDIEPKKPIEKVESHDDLSVEGGTDLEELEPLSPISPSPEKEDDEDMIFDFDDYDRKAKKFISRGSSPHRKYS